MVKIDVEGFECKVIRGMLGFIESMRPSVITEVDAGLLQNAGSSVDELFVMMRSCGYKGYLAKAFQTLS